MKVKGKQKKVIQEVYDLYGKRQFDLAISKGISALEKYGEVPELLLVLGLVSVERGDLPNAQVLLEAAYGADPNNPDITYNLGVVLQKTDDLSRAKELWSHTIKLHPNHLPALKNLGLAQLRARKYDEVSDLAARILEMHPDDREALNWRAIAEFSLDRLEEAEALYRRLCVLSPNDADVHYRHGLVSRDMCRVEDAIASFRQAIALDPGHADAHFELAQALLLKGNYEEGFAEYEWRRKREAWPEDRTGLPVWQGEALDGKSLLVTAEQGHGDLVQFLRFLPRAAERVGRLAVSTHPGLVGLVEKLDVVDVVEPAGCETAAYDAQVPIMSLAHIFSTTLDTVPPPVMAKVEPQDDGLPKGFKVGVVWAGNPDHHNDRRRSCSIEDMKKLFKALPEAKFCSFQVGERAKELEQVSVDNVIDLAPRLKDYEDTARLLKAMDAVVAVDTSVLHLAGALKVPSFALLPFAPDWRWLDGRADSPWYPSVRLYRQPRPGAWDDVVAQVADDLHARLASS